MHSRKAMLAEGELSVNGKCVLRLHILGTLLESIHTPPGMGAAYRLLSAPQVIENKRRA